MSIDPAAIVPTIVNVGYAAVLRAKDNGILAELTHVAIGRGQPQPSGRYAGYGVGRGQAGLLSEYARVPILSGARIDGYGFRVLARFPPTGGSEVSIREVAWLLSTGEPLCIWSEVAEAPLTTLTQRAGLDLAHDLYLSQVPLSALTITVLEPDIPDTAGALYQILALSARDATQHVHAEARRLRAIFAGA